eukprot:223141_1
MEQQNAFPSLSRNNKCVPQSTCAKPSKITSPFNNIAQSIVSDHIMLEDPKGDEITPYLPMQSLNTDNDETFHVSNKLIPKILIKQKLFRRDTNIPLPTTKTQLIDQIEVHISNQKSYKMWT